MTRIIANKKNYQEIIDSLINKGFEVSGGYFISGKTVREFSKGNQITRVIRYY